MGNESSYELPNITLVPLAMPVAAISQRFCHEEHLTLQQNVSSLSGTHRFRNAHADAVWFTVKKPSLISSRLALLDSTDAAVATFHRKTFTTKRVYRVHLGTDHDGDPAFEIHARYHKKLKTEVCVRFTDLMTHEQCELGFEGHWRKHAAYFWLDFGHRGVRVPVAEVFCPDSASKYKYHVAITPRMDTALIAMVCAILDKQQSQEEEDDEILDEVIESALF